MTIKIHAPNELQVIPLRLVHPSSDNPRKFIESEDLDELEGIYLHSLSHPEDVILPDAPILRFLTFDNDGYPLFECIAGERRITAAMNVGLTTLQCRTIECPPEFAYLFLLDHNNVAGLTTVERAVRAADMSRLGFSHTYIGKALGRVEAYRYIDVGGAIHFQFSDTKKLCDPTITDWHSAYLIGPNHVKKCFTAWDAGLWDEAQCRREFRLEGKQAPTNIDQNGFRVTRDLNKLIIRGRIDLDFHSIEEAVAILQSLQDSIALTRFDVHRGTFGLRDVEYINSETVGL